MDKNQFSIGDLVAHKHYPEQAIGHITQFYASGRVGVSGDRARSFLPKNLVLVVEQIHPLSEAIATESEVMEVPPLEVEAVEDAIATESKVMEVPPLEVEELGDAIVSDDGWLIYDPNDNDDDWPLYGPDDDDNDEDPRRIDYERIGDIIVEKLEVREIEELEDAIAFSKERDRFLPQLAISH